MKATIKVSDYNLTGKINAGLTAEGFSESSVKLVWDNTLGWVVQYFDLPKSRGEVLSATELRVIADKLDEYNKAAKKIGVPTGPMSPLSGGDPK